MSAADTPQPHPYYPIGVEIAGYIANESSVFVLAICFSLGLAAILGLILASATYLRPSMSKADKLAILWFALCKYLVDFLFQKSVCADNHANAAGTLHCFFEAYFVSHHSAMGPAQDILGQLWKEYALSDSRYLISDPFVVSIETITVTHDWLEIRLIDLCLWNGQTVWGPLCFVLAYMIAAQHPLRHALQVIICVAHLYGDALYYATSLFNHYVNGVSYCRPEALYFWGYFFFMNFIWIVVPASYLYESLTAISNAFRALDRTAGRQKFE
ncbi:hypothetical protein T310_1810 [Rasamsonia emersonii CBS 393.64]|uniref:EXPERA domain-containing protein n=1 Tax=Rasamsonia emersonii (strain ATCC 16479 / CBS 393.64 / IMI 116815) TaxID=1408163 RepID=A0A0F4Z2R2_RASE3|nr:hypothetical protein T310_1810 [Rasamsonia emersonii CBS 393.64]KKA24158.1 hypothetical protein T310_1810 [Rasamsonia emersonii CBS 393.64]